jgi:hypothetical protein
MHMTTSKQEQVPGLAFGVSTPEPVTARQVVDEMVAAGLLDRLMWQSPETVETSVSGM